MFRRERFIQVNDLARHYGNVAALEDVYFDVGEGETFALLGPAGSGKTTMVQLFLGLKRPTRGTAHILGYDCHRESKRVRERVGFVLGAQSFNPSLMAKHYLDLSVSARGSGGGRRSELVERLQIHENERIGNRPLGEAVRLAWTLALFHTPPVLLLDCPFRALDESSRRILYDVLDEEKARGATVLLTTDLPHEAARFGDRVGTLIAGELKFIRETKRLNRKLGRRLKIVFREDVELHDFITHNMSVVSHEGREWVVNIDGEVGSLVKRLGKFSVEDVTPIGDAVDNVLMDMMRGKGPGPYV